MEAVRSETGFPIGHIHKERAASGLSALGRCLCRVLLPERKSVADGGSEQEYRVAPQLGVITITLSQIEGIRVCTEASSRGDFQSPPEMFVNTASATTCFLNVFAGDCKKNGLPCIAVLTRTGMHA